MSRVIAYLRVSTGRQANEGLSLESQSQRVMAFAESKGIDAADVVIHSDAGLSGGRKSRAKRTGLDDALAMVGAGDYLVCYSLSRLARSTKHLLEISELCQDRVAHLVSISEAGLDTSTATGKLLFTLLAAVAEFEAQVNGERVKSVTQVKRDRNEKLGGVAPYGFKTELNESGKPVLVLDNDEQEIVAIAVELRAAGLSLAKVATELNKRGFRTRRNYEIRATGVRNMLMRRSA